MRFINSRFAGRCLCGATFGAGATVVYDPSQTPKIRGCPTCSDAAREQADVTASKAREPLAVRVTVTSVKYSTPDFAVIHAEAAKVQTSDVAEWPVDARRVFSVAGALGPAQVGDLIEVFGNWEQSKYGWQLRAARAVPVVGATLQSLSAFLARLPEVGAARAEKIIAAFGPDRDAIMDVLSRDPERVAQEIPGITVDRAKAIARAVVESSDMREVLLWLLQFGIEDHIIAKALNEWGLAARSVLEEDPYALTSLRGVGFRLADRVALQAMKLSPTDPRRAAAAVDYLLTEAEAAGDTWLPASVFGGTP